MSDEGNVTVETIDGAEYPVEQTDNSVKPEDGDQSEVKQDAVPDLGVE
jgi:hypothetical protein